MPGFRTEVHTRYGANSRTSRQRGVTERPRPCASAGPATARRRLRLRSLSVYGLQDPGQRRPSCQREELGRTRTSRVDARDRRARLSMSLRGRLRELGRGPSSISIIGNPGVRCEDRSRPPSELQEGPHRRQLDAPEACEWISADASCTVHLVTTAMNAAAAAGRPVLHALTLRQFASSRAGLEFVARADDEGAFLDSSRSQGTRPSISAPGEHWPLAGGVRGRSTSSTPLNGPDNRLGDTAHLSDVYSTSD